MMEQMVKSRRRWKLVAGFLEKVMVTKCTDERRRQEEERQQGG